MSAAKMSGRLDETNSRGRIFNGGWHPARGGTHVVIEPATARPLVTVGLANADDIAVACQAADRAQPAWAAMGARERAAILRGAAAVPEQHVDEIAQYVARETGGILPKGQHEVRAAAAILHAAAAVAIQPRGEVFRARRGG